MYRYTANYTDYNGNERKETHFFNLNKAEIMKMEMSTEGGMAERIQRIVDAKDVPAIIAVFEDLIHKSYGVKTPDGKGFIKRKEDLEEFMATEAYSNLFMELATNADKAAEFINQIIPADLAKQLDTSALAAPTNN